MDYIAEAFAEWERRRRDNPDEFPLQGRDGVTPEEYGRECAEYLRLIIAGLGEQVTRQ